MTWFSFLCDTRLFQFALIQKLVARFKDFIKDGAYIVIVLVSGYAFLYVACKVNKLVYDGLEISI